VFLFGVIKKGARRWLHVGFDIQPSEIIEDRHAADAGLVLPAAFQACCDGIPSCSPRCWWWFGRPVDQAADLGTALLVGASGFYVIFLAGLSWTALAGLALAAGASLPVAWSLMHDYQRQRVLTLIDPTSDPLGKGSTSSSRPLRSVRAASPARATTRAPGLPGVHPGAHHRLHLFGIFGRVWPDRQPVPAVLYLLLIGRGLMIAANAPTLFTRLLAGAITMIFFTYAFVNMGMVSGSCRWSACRCRS